MQKFIILLSFVCHVTNFAMDSSEDTPPDPTQELCLAIHQSQLKVVKSLIEADPSLINAYHTHNDLTCLFSTFSYKCRYYSAMNDRVQPLHIAVAAGNKDCVELLLKLKADPNAQTLSGLRRDSRPLHFATAQRIITLLVAKGAKIDAKNARGWTPLYQALFYPDRDPNFTLAKKLIKCRADIHQKIDGQTLLDKARNDAHSEIQKFLLTWIAISKAIKFR